MPSYRHTPNPPLPLTPVPHPPPAPRSHILATVAPASTAKMMILLERQVPAVSASFHRLAPDLVRKETANDAVLTIILAPQGIITSIIPEPAPDNPWYQVGRGWTQQLWEVSGGKAKQVWASTRQPVVQGGRVVRARSGGASAGYFHQQRIQSQRRTTRGTRWGRRTVWQAAKGPVVGGCWGNSVAGSRWGIITRNESEPAPDNPRHRVGRERGHGV